MTNQLDQRTRWRRAVEFLPADAWESDDGRFQLIWDPEGWHVWDVSTLRGVYGTLKAAKSRAEEVR